MNKSFSAQPVQTLTKAMPKQSPRLGEDKRQPGQPNKKYKQSPYFSQSAGLVGPQPRPATQPKQAQVLAQAGRTVRPSQTTARWPPPSTRLVSSGQQLRFPPSSKSRYHPLASGHIGPLPRPYQVRPQTGRTVTIPRPGMGRATPRQVTSSWPPPGTRLSSCRSLPSTVSSRQQLRFPPLPRYLPLASAQIISSRQFPHPSVLTPQCNSESVFQFPTPVPHTPQEPPNKSPPVITLSPPIHHKVFSSIQFQGTTISRQTPPSLPAGLTTFSPSMPVLPLPSLASALAGLGQVDGRKRQVKFRLTERQIGALDTIGIREVGIDE